jgi:hypothetical protein
VPLLVAFSATWILVGLLGAGLALQLGYRVGIDSGTLQALEINGVYRIIQKKMVRLVLQRLLGAMLACLAGIVFLTQPHPRPIHWTIGGLTVFVSFTIVKIFNVVASYLDLQDRDKILATRP